MKRKTNLFYTTGPDSKFLTFSNYTEYLTGNFLSSNYKMFPSKFLCVNVDFKNTSTNTTTNTATNTTRREEFINDYLVKYYENKLAFLREDCYLQNNNTETHIHPLEYLFDTLYKFDNNFGIPYIGAITEQDYNGAYADSICIIDMNDPVYGDFEEQESNSTETINVEKILTKDEYYVGWITNTYTNELYNTNYDDTGYGSQTKSNRFTTYISETYDTTTEIGTDKYGKTYEKQYNYESIYYDNKILMPNYDNTQETLEFNCIIPLFDIVEINKDTNSNQIISSDNSTSSTIDTNKMISTIIVKDDYVIHDIPFGIWISDKTITLERDKQTSQFPGWSLVISSQFKPLPYFNGTNIGVVEQNDHTTNEYSTFAQILSRQNSVMNTFNDINDSIYELKEEIQNINNTLDKVVSIINSSSNNNNVIQNTTSIFDRFTNDMLDYKNEMNDKFAALQKEVKENFKNITWRTTI